MAPLRPGRCYRHPDTPPYTRKEYIRSIPPVQIPKFDMGNPRGDFSNMVKLIVLEIGQVRANAIEAARRIANRFLANKLGTQNYHFKILIYPHHILRENKMMAIAGADRLQDGMRLAFGTPIGRAARVKAYQTIMYVRVSKENIDTAKEALRRAASKIPVPCRIIIE
ncbi:MAG: 50S ribosomal protein L16 [Thermoprotei archaeon]|nr:MAG: 50S ribosomal protein L16 [Thermoprotei archaeon]